jgi:hypothetical protein
MRFILFIFLLIATKLFGFKFLETIDWLSLNFFFTLVVFLFSSFLIKNENKKSSKNFIFTILVSLFLGTIVAYIDWGQNFQISLVAMRGMVLWLLIPVILKKQSYIQDLIVALKWFSMLYILIVIFCVISPEISIMLQGYIKGTYDRQTEYNLMGLNLVVFYFYFYLKESVSRKSVFSTVSSTFVIYVILILIGNRTTIFSFVLLSTFYLFKNLKINRVLSFLLISTALTVVLYIASEQFLFWYDESLTQINDKDYNRVKALNYFWNDYSKSVWGYLFGNGFASTHSEFGKLFFNNMERGIFQSDLGLFGLWTQFGILMVITLLGLVKRGLKIWKRAPWIYLMSVHILIANIIFSAVTPEQIMFWVVFYCFIAAYKEKSVSMELNKTK